MKYKEFETKQSKRKNNKKEVYSVESIKKKIELNLPSTKELINNNTNFKLSVSNLNLAKIFCIGLGSFKNIISIKQFCFLLTLLEVLNLDKERYNGELSDVVSCFDPSFDNETILVLESFGFLVLKENQKGKYTATEKTLFYMPHCPKLLYENLIYSNWSKSFISNLTVIGNSFSAYSTLKKKKDSSIFYYTDLLLKLFKEEEINFDENLNLKKKFFDTFNNTCLIYFDKKNFDSETNVIEFLDKFDFSYLKEPVNDDDNNEVF
ncbi:hypothetical protein HDU92_002529 [Lobulomyces angularis]|nr:hypothetical protein HDU92_002529 [Lobulomyces angularis]